MLCGMYDVMLPRYIPCGMYDVMLPVDSPDIMCFV